MPMTQARAHITLEPKGDNTDVHFRMTYEPKFGPVGKLMHASMMRRQFKKSWRT
jgi:hypothetical protein